MASPEYSQRIYVCSLLHSPSNAVRLFINGIELANGFHELTDVVEQRRRFENDRARRQQLGLRDVPVDERLLAALEAACRRAQAWRWVLTDW